MARPPTLLQDYIRDSPDATFDAVKRAGLFTKSAASKRQEIIEKLERTAEKYERETPPDITGDTRSDVTEDALYQYLNNTGQMFSNKIIFDVTPVQKVKVIVLKLLLNIRAMTGYLV